MATSLHIWEDEEVLTAAKMNDFVATPTKVPTGQTVWDTGWINLSYSSGYNGSGTPGQLAYRRVGMTVYLRGGASKDSGSFTAGSLDTVATLPAGLWPAENVMVGSFGTGLRGTAVQVFASDGSIRCGALNGVTGAGWCATCFSYVLE